MDKYQFQSFCSMSATERTDWSHCYAQWSTKCPFQVIFYVIEESTKERSLAGQLEHWSRDNDERFRFPWTEEMETLHQQFIHYLPQMKSITGTWQNVNFIPGHSHIRMNPSLTFK